jgi:hypothetical protein
MLIKDSQEIDDFFMERVWDFPVREQVHKFTIKLLNIYIESLSNYLELPIRDTHHLSREMGYHAISVFIDTVYRLKINRNISPESRDVYLDNKDILAQLFSNKFVDRPLGSSRVMRCNLSNIILHTLGSPPLFEEIQNEPEEIDLKDLDIALASKERYWGLHYTVTRRIPNAVIQYSKAYWACLLKKYTNNLIRIGYIVMDYKSMEQLPSVQWVPLDIELDNCSKTISIEERYNLYEALREGSLKEFSSLSEWETILGKPDISKSFFEAFLAFIVLYSEPLLCQKTTLHKTIESCKHNIQESKLQALFSFGNWFRFQNAIIATAGRKLRLPIIEFQSGGYVLDRLGDGFDRCGKGSDSHVDYILYWGGEDCNDNTQNYLKYSRVPNPFLADKVDSYSRHRNKSDGVNILYSPLAVSLLYSVENWLSISTYDMKEIRCFVNDSFAALDQVCDDNVKVFIKIKGFGYELYKDCPWMIVPTIDLNNISVRYITKGDSLAYFNNMDLHISCSNSTTFVYSLSCNIPTIILWNDVFKVKEEYLSLFHELEEVGIICTDIITFQEKYNKILNPQYWRSETVQTIRKRFCSTFGHTSQKWVADINNAITSIVVDSK